MFRKVTRFPGLMMPVLIIAFLCLLSGCGTGGLTDAPAGSSTGGATGGTTGGTTGQGVITFAVVKSSDPSTSTTSISQDSPAIVKATAKDSTGAAIAGKVMSFSSTFDIQLSPVSGTTLTDSNGTASITIMAGSTAGAATITASIKDNAGTAITNDVGIIVGLPNFSLSALTISPLTLSAGGTASVSVTVLDGSGNPYASAVPVSFTSRGVLQQPTPTASITSQVYTVKGVATATYKAIGYVGDDTVTATLSGTTLPRQERLRSMRHPQVRSRLSRRRLPI